MSESFLIVEDQENDAFFLMHALKKAGLNNPVQVVEDGEKAMEYLKGDGSYADRNAFPLPSLIFLDLKLPNDTGLQDLQWIREQPQLAPIVVVVFTSSNLDEDITQASRLGANSYVVKPPNLEKLVEVVKDLSNWWLKHDHFHSHAHLHTRLEVSGLPD